MPLFGKSAAQRYKEIGGILMPEFCDPTTYSIIESAAVEVIMYCHAVVNFTPGMEPVWHREIKRLVMDGYLLGRVEEGTEKDRLRFSTAGLKINDPEKVFRVLCIGTVKHATSGEPFTATAPRDKEIAQLLRSFAEQAILTVLESIPEDDDAGEDENWKRFGAVVSACIHLGRQIALYEGFFLNPKKRTELDRVIQTVREVGNESIQG